MSHYYNQTVPLFCQVCERLRHGWRKVWDNITMTASMHSGNRWVNYENLRTVDAKVGDQWCSSVSCLQRCNSHLSDFLDESWPQFLSWTTVHAIELKCDWNLICQQLNERLPVRVGGYGLTEGPLPMEHYQGSYLFKTGQTVHSQLYRDCAPLLKGYFVPQLLLMTCKFHMNLRRCLIMIVAEINITDSQTVRQSVTDSHIRVTDWGILISLGNNRSRRDGLFITLSEGTRQPIPPTSRDKLVNGGVFNSAVQITYWSCCRSTTLKTTAWAAPWCGSWVTRTLGGSVPR